VTRAIDHIEFHRPAPAGSILRFEIVETRRGRTSVCYSVDVFCDAPGASEEYLIFSTNVTFVSVDSSGAKKALADS
jgi:acyl-CoA hydrolase